MAFYDNPNGRDRLDDVLGGKLAQYKPSGGVPSWDSFEKGRHRQTVRRRAMVISAVAASAALILVVGSLVMPMSEDQVASRFEFAKIELPKIETHQSAQLQPQLIAQVEDHKRVRATAKPIDLPIISSTEAARQVVAQNEPTELTRESKKEITPNTRIERREPQYPISEPIKRQKRSNGLAVGMFADMGYGMGQSQGGLNAPSTMMQAQVGKYNSSINFPQSEFDHKFPLSFGVSVEVELIRNLSIETGLVYSYLESTAQNKPDMTYQYVRKSHYLGIPLSLQYTFLNHRRLDLYVSAGGMAEYALSARGFSTVYASGNQISAENQSLGTNGLMWSVSAFVGINIHLTPTIGIYVQPGINHYFKNDSHPINFRTQSEVQFDLRAGLRFSLSGQDRR